MKEIRHSFDRRKQSCTAERWAKVSCFEFYLLMETKRKAFARAGGVYHRTEVDLL